MAESMKDFERELEASFKRIDEGDIISGTVVSVDESGVVLDLKFYAEGFIPVEEFSRVPGFPGRALGSASSSPTGIWNSSASCTSVITSGTDSPRSHLETALSE